MSRLYVWLESDTGKQLTKTGNERMTVQLNYGSKGNSKDLVTVEIYYPHTNLKDDKSEPTAMVWIKGKRRI